MTTTIKRKSVKRAPKLRTLVLKSSQWLRGKYSKDGSWLYRGRGKHNYCCLGVLCREAGIAPGDMVRAACPVALRFTIDLPETVKWCVSGYNSSADANVAMGINDDEKTTDNHKLKLLRPIFRRNGWRLVFVNDEAKKTAKTTTKRAVTK